MGILARAEAGEFKSIKPTRDLIECLEEAWLIRKEIQTQHAIRRIVDLMPGKLLEVGE